MSDVHLTDKESPAQAIFYGYEGGPLANSSAYSAIILSTTQVLDAAVQTINALHQKAPFDFGIALGNPINNNQYNELRWYIDVIDGNLIISSSGAHRGAGTILYQKPYQPAGLDKSIPWYQVIGNHDQFWTGSALPDDYIRATLIGSNILNLGEIPPNQAGALSARGFYMGVVDGSTEFGDIIDVGPVDYFLTPPQVAADPARRSLTIRDWMGEFLNTTSKPVGHGFTQDLIGAGFACYHFYPRTDIPIKVIVFDDTDRAG
jgi:metallophosphoesterase (TIGR03768 family)